MFKKIGLRIIVLAVLLVALNFIYAKWFYENDVQTHSDIINLVREVPQDAQVIYLGESSNYTKRSDDVEKKSIAEFIGDYYPELNMHGITKPAAHAGIYKVLLENIPQNNDVKTVIVTLNLRSFSANWIYSNLETALQKSLVLIKPYPPLVNRFLLSFKAYDIKSDKEREAQFKAMWDNDTFNFPYDFPYNNVTSWDYAMAMSGFKDSLGNLDQAKTELACHFIKNYAFHIDTLNNIRINQFDEIIKLAQKRNWNLVFNLIAENTEKASELVGEDLIFLLERNTKILEDYYSKRGVLVVNSLNAVEDEQFIDRDWPTEHYAEKGRKAIAKNVAEAIKKLHPKEYKEKEDSIFYTAEENN